MKRRRGWRKRRYRKLIDTLRASGATITMESEGIYLVEGLFCISTRIIVTSQIGDEHAGLKMLSLQQRDEKNQEIGMEKGVEKGQEDLVNAISELKSGTSRKELSSRGYAKRTIEMAVKCINML